MKTILRKDIKRTINTGAYESITVSAGIETEIEYEGQDDLSQKSDAITQYVVSDLQKSIKEALSNIVPEYHVASNRNEPMKKYGAASNSVLSSASAPASPPDPFDDISDVDTSKSFNTSPAPIQTDTPTSASQSDIGDDFEF